MFDAVIKGALAAVGLTEEEANRMIRNAFDQVDDIHETIRRSEARMKRIEEKLGIPPLAEILPPEKESEDYGERNEAG